MQHAVGNTKLLFDPYVVLGEVKQVVGQTDVDTCAWANNAYVSLLFPFNEWSLLKPRVCAIETIRLFVTSTRALTLGLRVLRQSPAKIIQQYAALRNIVKKVLELPSYNLWYSNEPIVTTLKRVEGDEEQTQARFVFLSVFFLGELFQMHAKNSVVYLPSHSGQRFPHFQTDHVRLLVPPAMTTDHFYGLKSCTEVYWRSDEDVRSLAHGDAVYAQCRSPRGRVEIGQEQG